MGQGWGPHPQALSLGCVCCRSGQGPTCSGKEALARFLHEKPLLPHLCLRAGRSPPGHGGARASQERGGNQLDHHPPGTGPNPRAAHPGPPTPSQSPPVQVSQGPLCCLAEHWKDGLLWAAKLPELLRDTCGTVVWQRQWPRAPGEASPGLTPGVTLTSWEFLGELSSRSELCGHRRGVSQQAMGEQKHSQAWDRVRRGVPGQPILQGGLPPGHSWHLARTPLHPLHPHPEP